MSKALIDKIRRARESGVSADGRTYTVRRPTDAEALEMQGKAPLEFVRRFVVGWNVTEADLVPGGGSEVVPFSADLWCEFVEDRPQIWEPLATAILEGYTAHVKQREVDEKN